MLRRDVIIKIDPRGTLTHHSPCITDGCWNFFDNKGYGGKLALINVTRLQIEI